MRTNELDYRELSVLSEKVKSGQATQAEKDLLVEMMYSNGSISKKQYDSYQKDDNTEDIVKGVLAVAAIALIGYVISKLSD